MLQHKITEAIAINSEDTEAYFHRGLSFEEIDRHEYGIKDYKKAVSLGTEQLDAYLKLISHFKSSG